MTTARTKLTANPQTDQKQAGKSEDTRVDKDAETTAEKPGFSGQSLGENNISQGGTPGGVLKNLNFVPEPNPMGDFFQSTYHFSFYLDTDIVAEQGSDKVFVIAETGLTGMNIQSVEIESFVGPNIRTRNATATSITIKIFEPFGAQFPDLLFNAAVRMNIRNYLKAPWFLKLKLHGYDEDGTRVEIGDGWKWKLVLIDVESNISESGSMHTVTAMPMAEVALNNQFCMLPALVNTTGTTVGEVLKNVITSMNENVKTKYGDTNPPAIEYAIEDREYPYDTKVGVTRPFDHKIISDAPQDTNTKSSLDFGTQSTHFAPGTDVPAILDMLISRTETGMQIARLSREKPPTDGPDLEENIRDAASLMHRIDTKVEYLDYNAVIGDYAKKITYIVKPFQSLRLLTSMGRAMSFDKEKTLNRVKAKHAIDRLLLKKQYDYIFTGLNTEVEKFDINVNFRWAVSVPVIQGWGTYTGTTARVDLAQDAQSRSLALNQNGQELEAKSLELAQLDQQITEAGEAVTPEQTQRRAELDAQVQALKNQNNDLRTVAGTAIDKVNQVENEKALRRRQANPVFGRIIDGEDDIYDNAQSEADGRARPGFGGGGNDDLSYLPITIIQDPDSPSASVMTGTSTDNNSNKSIYGALLNQLYGSFDGNLQSLELEIRGDPYWLGPGADGEVYDEPSTSTKPNFNNGEHMFVFRFKLPQGYDQATGTVSVARDDTSQGGSSTESEQPKLASGGNSNIFTGFYAAVQVTHSFNNGYFSQKLSAQRIQGWTYENIIEGRENEVEDSTVFTDSNAPVSTTTGGNPGSGNTGNRGAGDRLPRRTSLTERELLAITLVGEAGGEGDQGMLAVGNVIANRTRAGYRGNTISEVIMSPRQFSVWNDQSPESLYNARKDTDVYRRADRIAGEILSGRANDITGGATSYLNVPVTAQQRGGSLPPWYRRDRITRVIGKHTFLKGV